VAEVDGDIVGQIMYAKTKIIHNDAHEIPAVSFGPVSILPDFQGSGIGSQLITTTLSLVRQEFPDIRYVIIMGDDAYYRRFGFLPAVAYGLTDEDGVMSEHLLVCDLHGGEPEDVGGKIVFGKTYNEIKEEEKAK
jgi:predicted N-acetyltransferase YhbS